MKKKALVTGASGGIGRAFAQRLAKEGYLVTAVARTETQLQSLMKELGEGHSFLVADLSTAEGIGKVSSHLTSQHHDLLVNNAGVGTAGTFTGVAWERQAAMLRLNIEALTALSYAFIKTSKAGDALINVSSTLAFLPMPSLGLYSATKAFVTSFTESLWFEQKNRGVYAMGLCPGITDTSFHSNAGGDGGELPKHLVQTPEQVVEVAMRALAARKQPTVISGAKNAAMATMARMMPRRSTVSMMGKMSPA